MAQHMMKGIFPHPYKCSSSDLMCLFHFNYKLTFYQMSEIILDLTNKDFLDSCSKLINAVFSNMDATEIRMVFFRHRLETGKLHQIIVFDLRDAWGGTRCDNVEKLLPGDKFQTVIFAVKIILYAVCLKIHYHRRRAFKVQYIICNCPFFH